MNFDYLKDNKYFENITLEKSGVLFDEGKIDNNIYILLSGTLSVNKYTTIEKKDYKQLAILKPWDIFGEGALKSSQPKEVQIEALENSKLLKIDAKEGMESFIAEYPKMGIDLLTEIIDVSNKRLLESNFLVTSNYHMSKAISEIETYNNKNLFGIFDNFLKIIGAEYILYLERNIIIDEYITLKYDTRHIGKMQNNVISFANKKTEIDNLEKEGIKLEKYNHTEELKNENEIIGYLVIGEKKNNFTEGQKKVISSITTLIAGVIKQKQVYEEEKNRGYMEEDE